MKKLKQVSRLILGKILIGLSDVKKRTKNKASQLFILNLAFLLFNVFYLSSRYAYVSLEIPFWYSKPWGALQLANKINMWLIPLISFILLCVSQIFFYLLNKYFIRYITEVLFFISLTVNSLLTFSLLRLIHISSSPFPSLINPLYIALLFPFIVSFTLVYFFTPHFITILKRFNIVTSPALHDHPAMVLKESSARGGGFIFAFVFILVSIVFTGFSAPFYGIYLGVFLLSVLGIFDDYQNTHPHTQLRMLENPIIRFVFLFFIVSIIVMSNIKFDFISSPFFSGVIDFSKIRLLPSVFTMIWIVWILNALSWSNGVDGQYSGVVGISAVIVSLLALRFTPLLPVQQKLAILSIIAAGASFGLAKYTWHPSKIMWGFSAMSAGLVIASVSILINAKIIISILIILVPFLDALVTFLRRIIQKKNPFKGDRGHLHHILLSRGYSPKQIASFYWITTLIFGLIGFNLSERYILQVGLLIVGLVASFIVLMNVLSLKSMQVWKQPVSDSQK